MTSHHHLPAALFDGPTPILPRPGFVFRRTPKRLFFIGFNKTATSALHMMLIASGIRAIHGSGNGKLFGRSEEERALIPHAMQHIQSNLMAGNDPIAGLGNFDAFLDLTLGTDDLCTQFKAFHTHHPDAVFVLNTRPEDSWIASRSGHKKSVAEAAEHHKVTPDAVPAIWRRQFRDHHTSVRTHFAGVSTFLEWQLGKPVSDLTDFLAGFGIPADPAYFFRLRETGGLYFPPPLRVMKMPTDVPILAHQGR